MGARTPEANIDICRLVQNSRSVTHHEASMTCTVETLEARLVREQSGGGQWACQVAGHADDQQPSSGRGRLRRREGARRRFDCVRKRVKTKNDTKDEEDAGTSPSDNSIVNSSKSSDTSTTKDAGVPPSYNSIVNTL